jgi:hypothetical protein
MLKKLRLLEPYLFNTVVVEYGHFVLIESAEWLFAVRDDMESVIIEKRTCYW